MSTYFISGYHEADATAKRARGSRRRYSVEFKRDVVEKTLLPGASVAAIALEHRLNTNRLFKWRRDRLRDQARLASAPRMLPVIVETSSSCTDASRQRVTACVIEIELPPGRIRLKGTVDVESLRAVVDLLRQLCRRLLRWPASESGRLRHGDGATKGGDRCPRGLKLAILSSLVRHARG